MSFGHWLSNAIRSAGHVAGALKGFVDKNSGAIMGAVGSASGALGAIGIDASGIQSTVGQVVQGVAHPDQVLGSLASQAGPILQSSPMLAALRNMVPKDGVSGYDAALSLMKAGNVSPAAFDKLRNSLTGDAKKAFDAAVSAHIGEVTNPPPPGDPQAQAAYVLAHGMSGATPEQQAAMAQIAQSTPAGAAGFASAHEKRGVIDRLYTMVFE